jgi:pyridoxal phosphate enzyme (YggS family)
VTSRIPPSPYGDSAEDQAAARRAELAGNLAAVRARIAAACAAAGRDAGELTLIAVTKTQPAADVLALAGLGVTDFGENRDQEAAPKAAACAGATITWHFIGQLQTNKAHSVASYAHVVHSVDRIRLVHALGSGARAAGRELTCLVQVSLDDAASHDPARGGVLPASALGIAEAIAAEEGLVLGGVMAVAPLEGDPSPAFATLRIVSGNIRSVDPAATVISAGMSGDLEAAVKEGATHLRIGTALLGNRRLRVR